MDHSQIPLANQISKSLSEKSRRCVVRIYITGTEVKPKAKDIGEVVGTGLLMKLGEGFYLATARHVFEDFQNQRHRELGFSTKFDSGRPLKVLKNQINLKHTNPRDDVAMVELNEPQVSLIQKDNELTPLELDDVWINYDIDPKRHVGMIGFPTILSKTNTDQGDVAARELRYMGLMSDKTPRGKTSYNKNRHFLIDYKELESMDGAGNRVSPPEPIGVSGGTAWSLFNHKSQSPIWTPADLKVIGICRTWLYKDELIQVTRMEVVLKLAVKMWPALEAVIGPRLIPDPI